MALSTHYFDYLRDFLHQKLGIVLEHDKRYLVESRLAPLARKHAGADLDALIRRIQSPASEELRRRVLEAMAIKETFFFRDPALMGCLRERLLPDLIAKRRVEQRLRIWSAACSTGQEAWTLCLMLRDEFPELADWDIEIVASDFSREALEKAATGRYGLTEINRGLPAATLVTWFHQRGPEWEIDGSLRAMVDFREINLIEDWPELPVFDLVLVRNVLIYFDDMTRKQVLTRVRRQLAPDGFLVLGGTERAQPGHGFTPGGHCESLPCYQPAG